MSDLNKSILQKANAAVSAGGNEGFLAFCADDLVWSTAGGETLHGKQAVRDWMRREYTAPPAFTVEQLAAESDTVVALGMITAANEHGKPVPHAYSDVWQFREGKMVRLDAYVIELA